MTMKRQAAMLHQTSKCICRCSELNEEYFQCTKCEYKSSSKSKITNHVKAIHEGEGLSNCNLCPAHLKSSRKFILHMKSEHGLIVDHFQCSQCEYKSARKDTLSKHIKFVHEGVARSKCDLCSAQFKSECSLKLHQENEHGLQVEYFQCKNCEYKTIYRQALSRHEKNVHEGTGPLKCNLCSVLFKSIGKLKAHQKDEHGLNIEYFQCSKCEYKSIRKSRLLTHIKFVHEGKGPFTCNLCSGHFKSKGKLELHKKNEHGLDIEYFQCSKCEYKSIYKANFTKHIKVEHEGVGCLKCNLCSEQFKTKSALKLHNQKVHGLDVEYFQCSKCKYKSITKIALSRHIKAIHEGVARFKCDLCPAQFKSQSTLKLHKNNEHGVNIDFFQCSQCKYKTVHKQLLVNHEKVKHDDTPFKCTLCSVVFGSAAKQKLHQKEKHELIVEYFHCSKCKFKSIRNDRLSKHIKSVHEGVGLFNCHLCSAEFKSTGKLELHKNNEHGLEIEYFQCSKCEYKTVHKQVLGRHEKVVHEGAATFNCNLCSAAFRSARKLKLHQKDEHTVKIE